MPLDIHAALGLTPVAVLRTPFDYLVEVQNEGLVRSLSPDLAALARWPVRGVCVTSQAETDGVDFVCRFFGPASGIDEDPVTGSAHCALAPYWAPRLEKETFVARQLSARGGELHVVLAGSRVLLRGQAVTVFRGELFA
jgi:predicted PhzF superfamily epimerase YddE/YHI9